MLAEWKQTRFKVEVALLLALCFFLPLLEAPKNLAWLGFAAAWVVNRIRSRDFGGRWDGWDTLFALWIASAFVVAIAARFGGIQNGEWGGAMDLLRYASVAWLLKRAGYAAVEFRWALGALVISATVGLAVGYFRMWSGLGKSGTLQLYSVGHVNHTAIYLAMMLGVWAAWVFAAYRDWGPWVRAMGISALAIFFASLAVTSSRGAVGAGVLVLFVLALAIRRRWSMPLKLAVLSTVVLIVAAVALDSELVRKQDRYEAQGNPFSYRDSIWRMGIAAWQERPWFGVGMDNYGQITHDRMKAWRAKDGETYDPAGLMPFSHAHSLYVNTLAERGIVGFGALAAVLLAWAAALIRRRPSPSSTSAEWTLWGASASGLVVTLAAGLFNTSLHHEHGILAALLLGLWLGNRVSAPSTARAEQRHVPGAPAHTPATGSR